MYTLEGPNGKQVFPSNNSVWYTLKEWKGKPITITIDEDQCRNIAHCSLTTSEDCDNSPRVFMNVFGQQPIAPRCAGGSCPNGYVVIGLEKCDWSEGKVSFYRDPAYDGVGIQCIGDVKGTLARGGTHQLTYNCTCTDRSCKGA